MEKKELLDALKEHGEKMAEKQIEMQSAINEKLDSKAAELKGELAEMESKRDTMQKQLDAMEMKLKNAEGYKPSKKVKSFAEELKEGFTKESEALLGMKNGSDQVKSLQLHVKSFLETANASVTTGSLLPQYQYDPGVSKAPDRMPFMMDLVTTAVANSLTVFWTQRKTRTDNTEWVDEGTSPTSQTVLGYETKTATMQNLGAFIKVSNNSLDDIDWLLSEIRTELVTLMMLKVDAALLTGTVATNGFDGVYVKADDFDADGDTLASGVTPNKYDVLKFAITQIKKANFRPNAIVLNPSDVRDMELERDDQGAYMLPPFMQSLPGVGGIRVVENNGMTAGSYLVGDFTKAKFWIRKGLDIRVWEQNDTDAQAQLKTITGYMRGTLVIKDADTSAFVKDTFAASITEITHA